MNRQQVSWPHNGPMSTSAADICITVQLQSGHITWFSSCCDWMHTATVKDTWALQNERYVKHSCYRNVGHSDDRHILCRTAVHSRCSWLTGTSETVTNVGIHLYVPYACNEGILTRAYWTDKRISNITRPVGYQNWEVKRTDTWNDFKK